MGPRSFPVIFVTIKSPLVKFRKEVQFCAKSHPIISCCNHGGPAWGLEGWRWGQGAGGRGRSAALSPPPAPSCPSPGGRWLLQGCRLGKGWVARELSAHLVQFVECWVSDWHKVQMPTCLTCGLLRGSAGGALIARNLWAIMGLFDVGSLPRSRLSPCFQGLILSWGHLAPPGTCWEEFLSRWPRLLLQGPFWSHGISSSLGSPVWKCRPLPLPGRRQTPDLVFLQFQE